MRSLALSVHVAAGTIGLIVGALAMAVPKRPHGRGGRRWHRSLGTVYQVCVTALCLSALVLVALKPQLWWLGVIGVATQVAAVVGLRTSPGRRPERIGTHIQAMCGSYISFVTAFLVVNLDGWWWWVLPTLIGSPAIRLATVRAVRGLPEVAGHRVPSSVG